MRRDREVEAIRVEEEAMGKRKAREDGLAEIWKGIDRNKETEQDAKNKAFMAIARDAIQKGKGFGGGF